MRKPPPGSRHWRTRAKRLCHAALAGLARVPGFLRAFVCLDRKVRSGHASYRLVMSLADAGRLPLAHAVAGHSLDLAVRAPRFPSANDTPKPTAAPPESHATMLTACLDDAGAALAALPHARPFVAYGTLLGLARHGSFLPGDADIDLGVFYPDVSPADVENILSAAGFHLTRRADPAWPGVTQAIHPAGGGLDVIYFKRAADAFLTHSVLFGQRIARRRPNFDLAPALLAGRHVWVPDPPERFLVPNYGDWRTRPVYYHNLLSPDLPVDDPTNPALAILARAECIRLIAAGRREPLGAFLELVCRRFPHDPLWPRVHAALAPHLSPSAP